MDYLSGRRTAAAYYHMDAVKFWKILHKTGVVLIAELKVRQLFSVFEFSDQTFSLEALTSLHLSIQRHKHTRRYKTHSISRTAVMVSWKLVRSLTTATIFAPIRDSYENTNNPDGNPENRKKGEKSMKSYENGRVGSAMTLLGLSREYYVL